MRTASVLSALAVLAAPGASAQWYPQEPAPYACVDVKKSAGPLLMCPDGTSAGPHASLDAGRTWVRHANLPNWERRESFTDGTAFYVSTWLQSTPADNSGLFRSTDGVSYTRISDPLVAALGFGAQYTNFGAAGGRLFVWMECNGCVVRPAAEGFYTSADGGATWTRMNGLPKGVGWRWTATADNELFGWRNGVFVAVASGGPQAVYRSTDGVNWTEGAPPPGLTRTDHTYQHARAALATGRTGTYLAFQEGVNNVFRWFLYATPDEGLTMAELPLPADMDRSRPNVELATVGDVLLLGGYATGTGARALWATADRGATWRALRLPTVSNEAGYGPIVRATDGLLYAANAVTSAALLLTPPTKVPVANGPGTYETDGHVLRLTRLLTGTSDTVFVRRFDEAAIRPEPTLPAGVVGLSTRRWFVDAPSAYFEYADLYQPFQQCLSWDDADAIGDPSALRFLVRTGATSWADLTGATVDVPNRRVCRTEWRRGEVALGTTSAANTFGARATAAVPAGPSTQAVADVTVAFAANSTAATLTVASLAGPRIPDPANVAAPLTRVSRAQAYRVQFPSSAFTADLTLPLAPAGPVTAAADLRVAYRDVVGPWKLWPDYQLGPSTITARNVPAFSEWAVATVGADALPVELLSFAATAEGGAARLVWATASETTNAGFHVERRTGQTWAAAGFVAGRGTTAERTAYAHTVAGLAAGVHRFRLRQVDLDGTATYSAEVEATVGAGRLALGVPAPNPARTGAAVTVETGRPGRVVVRLYDVLGRAVQAALDAERAPGVHVVALDLAGLPPGIYVVRLDADGHTLTRPLVVAR